MMADNSDYLRKVAALLGSTGVALGAIGAHAMKETLTKRNTLASYQTATLYQLFHATAILALSSAASSGVADGKASGSRYLTTAGNLMGMGTLMFSGSIYCLSVGIGPRALLGPTTPFGGLLMIGGWIVVGIGGGSK